MRTAVFFERDGVLNLPKVEGQFQIAPKTFNDLDELGEYRLRIESTLRYPVSKRLSLNLDVIDLYDTRPPETVNPNDLQIHSTIGVAF